MTESIAGAVEEVWLMVSSDCFGGVLKRGNPTVTGTDNFKVVDGDIGKPFNNS